MHKYDAMAIRYQVEEYILCITSQRIGTHSLGFYNMLVDANSFYTQESSMLLPAVAIILYNIFTFENKQSYMLLEAQVSFKY